MPKSIFNARLGNWGSEEHSNYVDIPLPEIWQWYDLFLAGNGFGEMKCPPAIAIGEN